MYDTRLQQQLRTTTNKDDADWKFRPARFLAIVFSGFAVLTGLVVFTVRSGELRTIFPLFF